MDDDVSPRSEKSWREITSVGPRRIYSDILTEKRQSSFEKAFVYSITEYLVPFRIPGHFFPYFCGNIVDENLPHYNVDLLSKYITIWDYSELLETIRNETSCLRFCVDFISLLETLALLVVLVTTVRFAIDGFISRPDKVDWVEFYILLAVLLGLLVFLLINQVILKKFMNRKINSTLHKLNMRSMDEYQVKFKYKPGYICIEVSENKLKEKHEKDFPASQGKYELVLDKADEHYFRLV